MLSAEPHHIGRRYVILIVDRDAELAEQLRARLSGHYQCTWAPGRAQAEAALAENRFDVVIADQRVSDIGLLAEIAQSSPLTRRIILSDHAEIAELLTAINQGKVSRYLLRPTSLDALASVIEESLHEYQREQALLARLFFERYGATDPEDRLGKRNPRVRPSSWPQGPSIEPLEPHDLAALTKLLLPELEVSLATIDAEARLDEPGRAEWCAEFERRLVSGLRDTDQAFRLRDGRFVIAFAHTPLDGAKTACDRIADALPGGIKARLRSWPKDSVRADATSFARAVIERP
jgi:DNA-binding NarL/FixJ family response regulator